MKRSSYVACLLALATALFSGAVVAIVLLPSWLDPFDDERFDPSAWPSRPAGMARDLVTNHIRPGMDKHEVITLLGPPESVLTGETDAGGNPLHGSETFRYYIGNHSLHGFDDAFVYVHLDSSGEVMTAEITGY